MFPVRPSLPQLRPGLRRRRPFLSFLQEGEREKKRKRSSFVLAKHTASFPPYGVSYVSYPVHGVTKVLFFLDWKGKKEEEKREREQSEKEVGH